MTWFWKVRRNPTCDDHNKLFETVRVAGALCCKVTEIRSEKFKSLHQSRTPYGSGVFAWKFICLSRVFNLLLFWNLYSFSSIALKCLLFPSPGWQRILILVMKEFCLEGSEGFIYFFLFDTVCFKMSFKLFVFLDIK